MRTWITDDGLSALSIAHANGLQIQITTFAVGTGTGLGGTSQTALETSVYSGNVSNVEWKSSSQFEVDTFVPPNQPAADSWALTEAGIYLDDGTLFAYSTFDVKTKESESETMIRWNLTVTGTSPTDITVTGTCWDFTFRGANLLVNSGFDAHGFNGLRPDGSQKSFELGSIVTGWKVWDEAGSAGTLVKAEYSDGALEIESQKSSSPVYLIQDLPASLLTDAAGGNLAIRVRAKSDGTSPKVRIGFLFDRDDTTEYLQYSDYTLDSSYDTYVVTQKVPSGSPVVTETISVIIAPLQDDKLYVDWAVCNLQDETIYRAESGVDHRVLQGEIIYPTTTATQLQNIVDEITANRDTNEYPVLYLAPGVFYLDGTVDNSNIVLEALIPGETKIILDDDDIDLTVRGLTNIEVDAGTKAAATNPAVTASELRGKVIISGSRNKAILKIDGSSDAGYFDEVEVTNLSTATGAAGVYVEDSVGHLLRVTITSTVVGTDAVEAVGDISIGTIFATGEVYLASGNQNIGFINATAVAGYSLNIGSAKATIGKACLTDAAASWAALVYSGALGGYIGKLETNVQYSDGIVLSAAADREDDPPLVIGSWVCNRTGAVSSAMSATTAIIPIVIVEGFINGGTATPVVDFTDMKYPAPFDINLKVSCSGMSSGIILDIQNDSTTAVALANAKAVITLTDGLTLTSVIRIRHDTASINVRGCTFEVHAADFLSGASDLINMEDDAACYLQHCYLFLQTYNTSNGSDIGGNTNKKASHNLIHCQHYTSGANPAGWTIYGSYNRLVGIGDWTVGGTGNVEDCIVLP